MDVFLANRPMRGWEIWGLLVSFRAVRMNGNYKAPVNVGDEDAAAVAVGLTHEPCPQRFCPIPTAHESRIQLAHRQKFSQSHFLQRNCSTKLSLNFLCGADKMQCNFLTDSTNNISVKK